ncbi:MFS transporter [Streptomyces xanthii]|uniref:MFS transporter n=1 Tax=Streptomyces xanthii TaxID=2768069 RepID=A0A7H1BKK6_9ACTN|nr:MFS transporter [Streptomyces xanthii]QNS09261.1 MFS transporter [Streptomyces xanthii]
MSAQTTEAPAPPPAGAAPAPPGTRRPARPGLALAVIAGCNAMIQLDDPIVNIALPGLRAELGLSPVATSWIVTAYLLTFGGLLLLGGRAGDILGRRKVFLAGVGLFTAAALLRGAATSGEFLVAVRVAQGAGAALAAPSGLALVLSMFAPGPARKRAIAVCTATGAVSTAGGLLLAGALTSLGSWRWVLYLDVPLGLAILLLGPFVLRETAPNPGRFDLAGALVSALGAGALVYGLGQAAERPWGDPAVVGCLAAAVALFAVFAVIERRAEQPIVLPRLFTDRERLPAYLATLAIPGALIGTYFFLNQFLQGEHGWSALATACALLPLPVTMATTALAAVGLERRFGPKRLMAAGATLLVLGNLWLATLDSSAPYATGVLPALVLLGAGMAACVLPPTLIATSKLRDGEAGAASSVLNCLQSVGGSIGLATLVTVSARGGMQGGFLAGAGFAALALVAASLLRRRSH